MPSLKQKMKKASKLFLGGKEEAVFNEHTFSTM